MLTRWMKSRWRLQRRAFSSLRRPPAAQGLRQSARCPTRRDYSAALSSAMPPRSGSRRCRCCRNITRPEATARRLGRLPPPELPLISPTPDAHAHRSAIGEQRRSWPTTALVPRPSTSDGREARRVDARIYHDEPAFRDSVGRLGGAARRCSGRRRRHVVRASRNSRDGGEHFAPAGAWPRRLIFSVGFTAESAAYTGTAQASRAISMVQP